MPQHIELHPVNPQPRLIQQAAQLLHRGEVLAVPTDSGYALACHLDDKAAADKLRRIRGVDDKHLLTLLCPDLSELATYARVNNQQYRLLKQGVPGAYTFILQASKEVPRRLSHPSRKTIGLRVPAHTTLQALLHACGTPLLGASLILPEADAPLYDAHDILQALPHDVAAVLDCGGTPAQPTTVIDLTPMDDGGAPALLRLGAGDPHLLGL